jgi:hypothetical protein
MSSGLQWVDRYTPEVRPRTGFGRLARTVNTIVFSGIGPALGMILVGAVSLLAPPSLMAADDAPILSDRAGNEVFTVQIEGLCSEIRLRMPEARVIWSVHADRAADGVIAADLAATDQFRIDFSKYNEGLERDLFDSKTISRSDAVDRSETVYNLKNAPGEELLTTVLSNLEPGVFYRTRVLALTPEGWVASREVQFMSPVCAVDGLDEMEGGVR